MSAHNPGPWNIGGEYSNAQDEIEAADGRTVAIDWTRRAYPGATARYQFKDDAELKSNARMVAAAPELLDALKECLDAVNRDCSRGNELFGRFNDELRAKARAAISKATSL
jgi:hypothetical protein